LVVGFFAIGFSVLRRSARTSLPEVAKLSEAEQMRLRAIQDSPFE
jgi:hypothetical protein